MALKKGTCLRHLAIAALLGCTACHQVALAQERWIEVTSDHFVLRGDIDEESAQAAVIDLEQTRSVFLRAPLWGGQKPRPAPRFNVVLLDELAELHEFAKPEIAGFVTSISEDERVVVMSAERETSLNPTLKHELAHAVAGQMLKRQPAWFAEGLACYLQNTHKDPDAPRDIIGKIDEERVQWLAQHGAMTSAEALNIAGAAELSDGDGARFESTAYEMFFALLNQRTAGLAVFTRMLAEGDEPTAAFHAAFRGLTPDKLDDLVRGSQTVAAHYAEVAVRLDEYKGGLASRQLSPAEVHAQLAVLFARGPSDDRKRAVARAEDEALAALKLDEENPEALELLAELGSRKAGNLREAARLAARLHSDSWRAQLLLARMLFDRDATVRDALAEERLAALQAALRLNSESIAALLLMQGELLARSQPEDALGFAQRAVALDPSDALAQAGLAESLLALHRVPEAGAALERAIEQTGEHASKPFVDRLRRMQKQLEAGRG